MKQMRKMLMLPLLALCACSGADDDVSVLTPATSEAECAKVNVAFGQNAPDMRAAGVESITVYVYKVEQKSAVLVDQKTIDATQTSFTYELPLGETYQTFAVANAASVSDKETFETATLHIDPAQTGEVWLSNVVRFSSDKSVKDIDLLLRRLVAEVNFAPAETTDELAAFNMFDKLAITFNNVATAYHVKSAVADLEPLTLNTTLAEGFQTRFFTFDTTAGEDNASVFINYLKNNESVNTSSSVLDAGVKFAASRRYNVVVPVTSPDFLSTSWTTRGAQLNSGSQITITETIMK